MYFAASWHPGILVVLCFELLVCTPPAAAQDGEVPLPTNLVAEGIPPIPASLAETVRRYTAGRAAEMLSWHPLNREMLIVTFFGNTPQVHQIRVPAGARTQLTFFEDRVGSGVSYEPGQGRYFLFSKDAGGDQQYQNYHYDFSTGNVTLLTDGKSKNTPGVWSRDGHRQVYGSTRRTGRDVDFYSIDPSDPKTDRLLVQLEGGGWLPLDWSPDDREVLAVERISINESYLWLIVSATGEKRLLTPKGGPKKTYYESGQFTPDGTGIYVITDKDSEFRRLALFDLNTRRHRFLTGEVDWDVYEFQMSPDGRYIAFIVNADGFLTLRLLATSTYEELPLPGMPSGYVIGLHWHPNGRDLGFTLASARSPDDAYSLDVETGKVERWTFSETGGLHTEGFTDPELIRWRGFDGRMISGVYYRPPARFQGKRPVIIDVHGGPEAQFQPYFLGQQNYYLNELGVALIFPNIRGSAGYGKTFLMLDNGYSREGAYKDIESLLDWIGTHPDLDADRIMVTGASYGGNVALAVAARCSDRIRCAVDIVGPSNFVTFLQSTAGYRQDLRRAEYGDERDPKMRAFLEGIAPLAHASSITKPLLVVQGGNDPIVPVSEAEQLAAAVRGTGATVWYLMAKDEGHRFFKKENSDYEFYVTVRFVQEFLLN